MLVLALVAALVAPKIGNDFRPTAAATRGDGGHSRGAAVGGCPHGNVQIVSSKAKADYSVRFVSSAVAADCVVEWTTVAPGPGHWREVSSFPDFRIVVTEGIADITVYAR